MLGVAWLVCIPVLAVLAQAFGAFAASGAGGSVLDAGSSLVFASLRVARAGDPRRARLRHCFGRGGVGEGKRCEVSVMDHGLTGVGAFSSSTPRLEVLLIKIIDLGVFPPTASPISVGGTAGMTTEVVDLVDTSGTLPRPWTRGVPGSGTCEEDVLDRREPDAVKCPSN